MTTPKRGPAALLIVAAVCAGLGLAAAKPKLDPESAKFYETARLIMTKEEKKIFELLPDVEGRKEFIADFWHKRDPDPDTPDNEFKKEFDARLLLVSKRFNKEGGPGYNTDRGRIFIFMGPPDNIEETLPQDSSSVHGFIVRWTYIDARFSIEFVDQKGDGRYRINSYEGDLFGAMDLVKLGRDVRADDVFSRNFLKFHTVYDPAAGEIEVRLPTKGLMFRENDQGRLQLDLRFLIYIYPNQGTGKESFADARSIVVTDEELAAMKTVNLRFGKTLKPGTNYVDVIVMGKEGMQGKIRQIFEIKVPAPH